MIPIDSVKIGAMTYKINMVNDLYIGEGNERKDLHGQIWQDKLQIDVEADQDAQMQAATILHESLHGILNHAGQEDHEERFIIALGYGLVQFIRDNPQLVDLIQHGERRIPPHINHNAIYGDGFKSLFVRDNGVEKPLNGSEE